TKSGEILKLNGKWEFYWGELLTPETIKNPETRPSYIDVPAIWNNLYIQGRDLDGQGYATYRLKILLNNPPENLSLDIPNVYSAYKLFVNGHEIAQNGSIGIDKATSQPEWNPKLKIFQSSDTVEIICQVSNYHHERGGIHKPLFIGDFDNISSLREKRIVANMMLTGGLIVLAGFFIVFFALRPQERSSLYFGLFCLLWAVRSVFSNIYLVSSFFDLSWSFALRIEYLSLYTSVLFGVLFLNEVFNKNGNQLVKSIIIIVSCIFVALTIMLPTVLFTQLLPAYQIFVAINLVYAIYMITKALFENQAEAWFSAMSMLMGVALFGYEMINYLLILKLNLVFLNVAYLSVFFLNSLVLAYQFVETYKQAHDKALQEADKKTGWVRGKRLQV
ncbi:membrane protein, partial [Fulvivirga sp. RKSG066]|uniref:7TM-DISM domain-containing protein n=1 Tax=Fulvivirga aurantia TaxID=2529383 RepID=UPI0012BCCBDB